MATVHELYTAYRALFLDIQDFDYEKPREPTWLWSAGDFEEDWDPEETNALWDEFWRRKDLWKQTYARKAAETNRAYRAWKAAEAEEQAWEQFREMFA